MAKRKDSRGGSGGKGNEAEVEALMGVSSKGELKRKQKQMKKLKSGGFESLGLCPEVYRGVKRKGYRVPTPIQRKTMPVILAGADVVAMARTGSGKTAAFLIPMLQRLRHHVPQAGIRALILSPTRDLTLQTLKFTQELGKFTDLRSCLLVGGDSMESQFETLAQSPDIIIATPGRLMHHLTEVEGMTLRTVEYVVFDEADSLFEMGFAEQLHKILQQLSETRQTLLFSATLPSALAEFAKAGLRDPQLVRLDLETKISPDLKLTFFTLRHEEKVAALLYVVREVISSDQQTLIFVSTKHHVEFLNALFREEGIEPSVSYGDMDQDARKIHISKFRSRKTMLLIVTDVAARGIDIPLLDNVVNYDFPPKPKLFVHRVGRAARAGRLGTAYSFVTSEDVPYLLDLHLFLSKPLKAAPMEEELLQDMDGVYSKINQALANGVTVYGRLPQTILDLSCDRVHGIVEGSVELTALQKASCNAFRLYTKTKPLPSKESIKRMKDLPREGLHPIFKDILGSNELTAYAFSERLKAYRPKQTILEAEAETMKSKTLQGGEKVSRDDYYKISRQNLAKKVVKRGANQWLDIMRKKRAVHEEVINLVHQNRTADKTLKHLEAGLSVKGSQGFSSSRLEAAVLDLVADDSTTMQKQKAVYHWDKRSKKYIKLNNGERVTATGKIKTESGAKVKAEKSGMYKKWKEKTHKKITLVGAVGNSEEFTGHHAGSNQDRGIKRNFIGGKNRRSMPNASVKSELRDPEQVRKNRQQKASRIAHFNSRAPHCQPYKKFLDSNLTGCQPFGHEMKQDFIKLQIYDSLYQNVISPHSEKPRTRESGHALTFLLCQWAKWRGPSTS
ncbi:DEAD-box ATP-dependent RNA helicase 29 [Apostasia shenzhenica]|uniref:RNA helicase n=1 Tax=Apostasia shenzhenica TaxID=1088818 RepID=A0A2I0AHX4_9ASPA|nr:DEAD-box ATP-dependent RNA helicase 29 [Apostasia shenzhenica]